MPDVVELEVILAQFGDVNQPLDIDRIEGDEDAEWHHGGNGSVKLLADEILHVIALEPVIDVTRCLVRASLGHRTVQADVIPACRRIARPFKHGLDRPMHEQIGIAPDRRGEVCVVLVGKPEMTHVIRAIHRLAQRTQHDRLQQLRVGAFLDLLEQRAIVLGRRVLAPRQPETELVQEAAQGLQLFGSRPFVNAIQARLLMLLQKRRGAHVRRQHAFLDQTVRVVTLHRNDVLDLALIVEQHHRLDRLEVDRPALVARLEQHLEQRVQGLQLRQQLTMHFIFWLRTAIEPTPDLVVGQTSLGTEHRRIERIRLDFAGRSDVHVANHCQPLNVGIERAQTVGKLLGEHRNNPAREIDRITALHRLAIERHTRSHVMADVCNRHDQSPAAPIFLGKYRVVEVLGRFTVNRHQRQIAEVLAPSPLGLPDLVRQRLGFRCDLWRELEWKLVLAQGNFDFHAGIGIVAKNFDDLADRLRVAAWLLDDLHHHHLAGSHFVFPVRNYEDVLIDPPVLGNNDRNAVLDQDASDHLAVRPLQHLDDRAFTPPLAIDADYACQRPVAMQDLGHLFGIEEEIVTTIVGNKEAVAVRMPFDATGYQAGALRNDVRILPVAHQLRLAFHRG